MVNKAIGTLAMTRTQLRRTPPRHHLLECMVQEGVHGCQSQIGRQ